MCKEAVQHLPVHPETHSLKYTILFPLGLLFHLEYACIRLPRNVHTYTCLLNFMSSQPT